MDKEQVLKKLNEVEIGIIKVEYEVKNPLTEKILFEVYNGEIAILSDEVEYKYNNKYDAEKIKESISMGYEVDNKDKSRSYRWGTFERYFSVKKDLGFKEIEILLT